MFYDIGITGSWNPILAVRSGTGGSLSGQVNLISEFSIIPEISLCNYEVSLTVSGSGFDATTILDLDLPFDIDPDSAVGSDLFYPCETYEITVSGNYPKATGIVQSGGSYPMKNISIGNPSASIAGKPFDIGGHADGALAIRCHGYFKIKS